MINANLCALYRFKPNILVNLNTYLQYKLINFSLRETFLSQCLNIHNLWAKLVCIPKNFFSHTAMSKLVIDLYYFVKSSFLKIETVNDDISCIHLIPIGTNRNWKLQVPAGSDQTKIIKKLQIIFLSNAKFFVVIVNIFLGQKPS